MKQVFAYIGVIGSGKDFAAKNKSLELGGVRVFDFSDGVRELTFGFLDYHPEGEDYTLFKSHDNVLRFPISKGIGSTNYRVISISGRKFLENVGITMRKVDPDFWAKFCFSNAKDFVKSFDPDCIIFNAVRYQNEADYVKLFRLLNYDVKFIFTNYKSDRYEIRNDDSEKFAQKFLNMGCEHMQDITNLV